MLAPVTPVSLRHTGREIDVVPPATRAAPALTFAAAALRLWTRVHGLGPGVVARAAGLSALVVAAYLWRFAAVLVAPSLPR